MTSGNEQQGEVRKLADLLYQVVRNDIPPVYQGSWRRIVLVKIAQFMAGKLDGRTRRRAEIADSATLYDGHPQETQWKF